MEHFVKQFHDQNSPSLYKHDTFSGLWAFQRSSLPSWRFAFW